MFWALYIIININLNFFPGHMIPINIPASHYAQYVNDDVMMKMVATAMVDSTDQIAIKDVIVNLGKPTLRMDNLPDMFIAMSLNEFFVSFRNPLDKELTNCEMYIDGSIIQDRIYMDKLE